MGVAGLGGTGGGDGVLGVALAPSTPALTIGTVHFHDSHRLAVEVAGEPGPIGTGSLDADEGDRAEASESVEESAGAAWRRLE